MNAQLSSSFACAYAISPAKSSAKLMTASSESSLLNFVRTIDFFATRLIWSNVSFDWLAILASPTNDADKFDALRGMRLMSDDIGTTRAWFRMTPNDSRSVTMAFSNSSGTRKPPAELLPSMFATLVTMPLSVHHCADFLKPMQARAHEPKRNASSLVLKFLIRE